MEPDADRKLASVRDAEKSTSWSEATSPTATITTIHTMALAGESSSEAGPKTPPTNKRNAKDTEESEHDSISVMTPSQPLHDKLEELEQRWSEKRPSRREDHQATKEDAQYMFAAGGRILHQPSRPRTSPQRTPARKKGLTVEIIGSPDEFRPGQKKQSVFERLYQQSSTASRAKRRRPVGIDGRPSRTMPSPQASSSVEGTISTLSSSESIFNRLYKNEKRKPSDLSPRRGSRSVASANRGTHQSDSMSAAASLERRLAYAAPPVKRRNRVSSSGKVALLIQQHESSTMTGHSQPSTPQSRSSRSPRTPKSQGDERSVSSNADSVFDRLYRGEKRKTPVLSERSTVLPVKTKRPHPKDSSSPDDSLRSDRFKSSTHSSTDSVFERLYKGEKRKTPLTVERRKRPQNVRRANQETERIQSSPRADTIKTENEAEGALLEDCLRAADSDDSLLVSDLPEPTVLSFANASEDTQQKRSRVSGATSHLQYSGKESDSSHTLARLKLQVYVRRIQRCARAYIARRRVPQSRMKFSTAVQSTLSRANGRMDSVAILIQRVWRGYHSRLMTVASLLQTCLLDLDFSGSSEYTGVLLLRLRMQVLLKAISYTGEVNLAKLQVGGRRISIDWSKDVVIHFRSGAIGRMETVAIALKCRLPRYSFLKKWNARRISSMVVKAVLLEYYRSDSERLVNASVDVIQTWARTGLEKRYKLRRLGRVRPIRTAGLEYRAQYLTPTSLQQRSATILQSAWRFHQAQVRAAENMLTSWRVKCDMAWEEVNRVLAMKVGLQVLMKAIGRVDCFWITETISVGDCLVFVKWGRELGIHFVVKGVPRLETCTVHVDCEASRTAFVEKWGRRKLAILIVKAALAKAIRRDRSCLTKTAAALIQIWYRARKARIALGCRVEACRTIQKFVRRLLDGSNGPNDKTVVLLETRDSQRCNTVVDRDHEEFSASIIQSFVRKYLLDCQAQRRESAACTIQSFARQHSARRRTLSTEAAAIIVQSSLRSFQQQRTDDRNRKSAESIQKAWRATSTRDAFSELKRAAIIIQMWERRRQCHSLYLSKKDARTFEEVSASRIQCLYRGALTRQYFEATRIQAAYRRHAASSMYRSVIFGVVALQAAYRGIKARRLILLWHALVARSRLALLVQTHWRGSRDRIDYSSLRNCAIILQAAYRKHYTLCRYRQLLSATLALQRRHRGARIMRQHSRARASMRIQSAWRGAKCRSDAASLRQATKLLRIQVMEGSAVVIQRWYRCWVLRSDFLALRRAVIQVQSFERLRKCYVEYQSLVNGMILFQAMFRGYVVRMTAVSSEASAKLFQRIWRGSQQRKHYLMLRSSTVLLQSSFRRRSAVSFLRNSVVLATLLQALCRGYLARRSSEAQSLAAINIQSAWRGERARSLTSSIRQEHCKQSALNAGILSLQRAFRDRQQRRLSLSTVIQCCYRRHVSQQGFRELRLSVVRIQAAERRRQSLAYYSRFAHAVVCLQARQRGALARKLLLVERSHQVETAAVRIQALWRSYFLRLNFAVLRQIAVRIQAFERRRQAATKYQLVLRFVNRMQSRCRGAKTRETLSRQNAAAAIIQRYYRRCVARHDFMALSNITIKIQAAVRRRQSLLNYTRLLRGVTFFQAHYRGIATRRELSGQHISHGAAALIQRKWRSLFIRQRFLTLRLAAVRIQSNVRRHQCLFKFSRIVCGIVHAQATYRGFQARQALMRCVEIEATASIRIQSCWRRYSLRRKFLALVRLAMRLQAQYRGASIRQILNELTAAVIMQRYCRAFVPRIRFLERRQAAVRIQTMVRCYLCHERYSLVKRGVPILQAHCRGCLVRYEMRFHRQAAVRIQAKWRAALVHDQYRTVQKAVDTIHRTVRGRRAMNDMRTIRKGIVLLQATRRAILARRVLQEQHSSAIALQNSWARYRARSSSRLARLTDEPVPLVFEINDGDTISHYQPSQVIVVRDPEYLAAATIQSSIRCFLVKHCLERTQKSARLIQMKYFTWKMQLTLLMVQSSVVLLQRSVRGQLTRSAARFALSHINSSLRSSIIGSFERITSKTDPTVACIWYSWNEAVESAEDAACIVIQSAARRMISRRYSYELRENQSSFRQLLSKNALSAYTSIRSISSNVSSRGQTKARGSREHSQERTVVDDTTVEEPPDDRIAHHQDDTEERIRNIAACRVQTSYRRRLEMQRYTNRRTAIVSLQSRLRGARARSEMVSRTHAAVRLQKVWRKHRARLHYYTVLRMTILIQAECRAGLARQSFQRQKQAAHVIQRRFRVWQQGFSARMEMALKIGAVVCLQRSWRMQRDCRHYDTIRKLVLALQSRHRMRVSYRSYYSQIQAARVIQNAFRAFRLGNVTRSEVRLKMLAIVRLQQSWRMIRERRQYQVVRAMTIRLQAFNRMQYASRSYLVQKTAALILQTAFRSWSARMAHLDIIDAIITMQATVRQFLVHTAHRRSVSAAISIQRVWRGMASRKQYARLANDSGTALGANLPTVRDGMWSSLDRAHLGERLQESIMSEVQKRSKYEADRLVEGDTACLESAGICIRRLVHRVASAREQASTAAKKVDDKREHSSNMALTCIDRPREVDEATTSVENGLASTNDGVATSTTQANRSEKTLKSDALHTHPSNTELKAGPGEAATTPKVQKQELSLARDTRDLAAEAQQLLLEARRARVKFQQARPQQRTPTSAPFASPVQPPTTARTAKTPMFGKSVEDEELPSPIKPEDEDWDWTKGWKY